MPSFSIPLSGLQADSTALNTIANNLSNMNTTGYKSQSTTFSDLFYQTLGVSGSGNEIQVGAGTQVASTTTNFTNGSVSSTGVSTDMAISGNGFFVVEQNGVQELTRDGSFSLDSSGHLITASGQSVMGYPATNGVVNTSAALTGIQIPVGQVEQPKATSSFTIDANLNASATTGTTFVSPLVVYDSLGASHTAEVTYTKTGTNTWGYNITLPDTIAPSTTTSGGTTTTTFALGSAATVDPTTNLTISGLTSSGTTATIVAPAVTAGESLSAYQTALSSALTTAGITGVTVSTSGNSLSISGTNFSTTGSVVQDAVASANAAGTLNFSTGGVLTSPGANVSGITFSGLPGGASNLNMTWDLYSSSGSPSISQESGVSTTSSTAQNGYASGQYSSFTVDGSGNVIVSYSNNQKQTVGQVALATVANQQGLVRVGSNSYSTSLASGDAVVGVAGIGGRGTVSASSLEGSNVDTSTEFANLIVAQRAFQANSKAVSAFDTVTQTVIDMIR